MGQLKSSTIFLIHSVRSYLQSLNRVAVSNDPQTIRHFKFFNEFAVVSGTEQDCREPWVTPTVVTTANICAKRGASLECLDSVGSKMGCFTQILDKCTLSQFYGMMTGWSSFTQFTNTDLFYCWSQRTLIHRTVLVYICSLSNKL